jgi:hypothetical protein
MVLGSTRLAASTSRYAPIYIDHDATEQLLESLSVGHAFQVLGRRNVGPVDLGRALGRVLAHEIGHVVLAAAKHQSRASLVAEDLTPAMALHAVRDGSGTPARACARA